MTGRLSLLSPGSTRSWQVQHPPVIPARKKFHKTEIPVEPPAPPPGSPWRSQPCKGPAPSSQAMAQMQNECPVYRCREKTVPGLLLRTREGRGAQTHAGLGQNPDCVILASLSSGHWFPYLSNGLLKTPNSRGDDGVRTSQAHRHGSFL